MKSYLDYGAYTPIQVAAAAALNGPDDCIREMRATYKRRRDVMVESFAAAGWPIDKPSASMFAWTPVPGAFPPSRQPGVLEAPDREGRRRGRAGHRLRRARRRLSCASRWSRTSSASARPRAASAASSRRADATLHNVVPLQGDGLMRKERVMVMRRRLIRRSVPLTLLSFWARLFAQRRPGAKLTPSVQTPGTIRVQINLGGPVPVGLRRESKEVGRKCARANL